MLQFNPERYDFSAIEKAMLQYYRFAEVLKEEELYFDYPGNERWKQVIIEKSGNAYDEEVWKPFLSAISARLNKEVADTTFHSEPSHSGYVLLEELVGADFLRVKKLYFFVSLLGPFYAIMGADESNVLAGRRTYHSLNLVIPSPEREYEEAFRVVDEMLLAAFPTYKLLPYSVLMQTPEAAGLKDFSILKALFHNTLLRGIERCAVSGNKYFGMERWERPGGPPRWQWQAYPPNWKPEV